MPKRSLVGLALPFADDPKGSWIDCYFLLLESVLRHVLHHFLSHPTLFLDFVQPLLASLQTFVTSELTRLRRQTIQKLRSVLPLRLVSHLEPPFLPFHLPVCSW
jgi:hypothetical protein